MQAVNRKVPMQAHLDSDEGIPVVSSKVMGAGFAPDATLTRPQIFLQAGTAMLSDANLLPESVLLLLK